MPADTTELVSLFDLEHIDGGLFRGPHPDTLMQRLFGGQVLAQSLVAMYATVPDERPVHSLSAYFLRPGRIDMPMIFEVENTRDGKSFTTRRLTARQAGEDIFTVSASFHVQESGLDHHDPAPLDVPPAEECPSLFDVMEQRFQHRARFFSEWDALEVRYAGDSSPMGSITPTLHEAAMRVWVKTGGRLSDEPWLHHAILAYLSDITLLSVSTLPHEVVFMSKQMQAASIDHRMWFHRPFRADEWLLYDMVSPSASGALGFSTGRLFQDGRLVSTCAQEGLIRILTD